MKIKTGSKIILTTVCGIILLSAFMFLPVSCQKKEQQDRPGEKVTLGVASLVLSAPLMVAQEKGFFSEEGLNVTYKPYPFGKKAMEAVFSGEADIATVAETPIVFNSFIRNDFAIFATFVYSYDDSKIIVRKDSGISTPADLKGKKIGVTAKTSSHFFAHVYLSEYGIDPASEQLIDFPAPDLPDALKDGKVDAVAVFEPYGYITVNTLPDKVIILPKSVLFKETFNLIAMKSYTKKHPETLKKILKAVNRSITYMKQNRNESMIITEKYTGLDKTVSSYMCEDSQNALPKICEVFVFDLSLENSLFNILEDEARWAIKNGFTDKAKVPNYLEYFYPDAMKAVKPDAVSIIK